jgi:hypothetical protein
MATSESMGMLSAIMSGNDLSYFRVCMFLLFHFLLRFRLKRVTAWLSEA